MPAKDIGWAVEEYQERAEVYSACSQYYDGDHPLLFATEKFRNTFGTLFQAFADNLCPTVVDSVADRLSIMSWDGKRAKRANKLWKRARVGRVMAQTFTNSGKCGDAYVFVARDDDGVVRFYPHDADQVCIEYDTEQPGVITKAAKFWMTNDDLGRLNLYYNDHIEKYQTERKLTGTELPSKTSAWQRIDKMDNPYGRPPVFHFGCDANIGEMGVSDLKDVIPLQNALNKSVCDMLVAMEFVAMPQRWATGLQVEVDEDSGKPINPPFVPGVDRVWTAAGEVKFGQFDGASLEQFLSVQNGIRKEISRVSGTPLHMMYLEEQMPTGESLKVGEGRLIKKCERRHAIYGDEAADMLAFGMMLDGGGKTNPDELMPVWANAAPHNPLLDAETQLVKQQVGVSKHQSLVELGYSDEQIEQMQQEADEEAQRKADAAMQAFNTGTDPSGKPTAFNRNGSPGQSSRPAPMQQQQKKPVPVPTPKAGAGQYGEG